MDALSQLLTLTHTEVRLDVRCLLAGSFLLANEATPPGEAAFHLVLSGSCQLQTEYGPVRILEAGDFVLLPQGPSHTLIGPQGGHGAPVVARPGDAALPVRSNVTKQLEEEVDVLCGRFLYAGGSGPLFTQTLPSILHVNLQGGKLLHGLVALLREESQRARPGSKTILNALGQALFTMALRAHGTTEQMPASVLALTADSRLGPSIRAMLSQPGQPWTIESLGTLVGMSRATYARHFHEKSGMTVGDLLQRIRMMHACETLRSTSRSLADVAQSVGYQSEAAFGKIFRQVVGAPPGQWRRQVAQK